MEDVQASNGIIHVIDQILKPKPNASVNIMIFFKKSFSTLLN